MTSARGFGVGDFYRDVLPSIAQGMDAARSEGKRRFG